MGVQMKVSATQNEGHDEGHNEGHGVSRRTVARTAAWATPVVVTALGAPAYAATSGTCADSGSYPMNQGLGTKVVFLAFFDAKGKATGVQADVSVTATDKDGQALPAGRLAPDTRLMGKTDYTPSWNYITLHHPKGLQQGDTLTLTITFNRVVRNAKLTITDIDKATGQWIDQVYAAPAGYSAAKSANVVGAGAAGDPFTSKVEGEIHTSAGDLTLTWPAPLRTVTITYVAGDQTNASDIGQHIGVGQFSYSNCG
jgi:hypothetical protein